ncbi:hypothetical protein HX869_24400 [Pseudomonas sp. P7779]|uniref:hypothetical protein n=1 Tax=Pseudomonas sp. P7779 TaxID=2738832 RepID=UPI0015B96495|nr:hypothetical protein [Pseudomonas sp. P7779]NWD01909.1 hypothetical protein [Pseudomonas sp. P7779]
MAEAQKVESTAVRLTGIEQLSPKLAALQAMVGRFRQNLEQTGLGKLDVAGLVKGGGLAAPFISGINSALAFKAEVGEVNAAVGQGVTETAAQGLKDFNASLDKVSVAFGTALLPAVTAVVVGLEPLLTTVAQVLTENPQLVQGLAAGAVAFTAMQAAVTGVSQALGLMQLVLSANPIVLVAVGIAVAAGLIVANWKPISAFFVGLGERVMAAIGTLGDFFQTVFAFRPLEQVMRLWGPITGFFAGLWTSLKVMAQPLVGFFTTLFSWSPMGLIVNNWTPLSGFFAALWDLLKALSVPVVEFMKSLFSWSPQGQIIANWGVISEMFAAIWSDFKLTALAAFTIVSSYFDWSPLDKVSAVWGSVSGAFASIWGDIKLQAQDAFVVLSGLFDDWHPMEQLEAMWAPVLSWFTALSEKLAVITAPIRKLFNGGLGEVINQATGSVLELTTEQQERNAESARDPSWFRKGPGLVSPLASSSSSLLQQTAANNRTQLNGDLRVSFDNAPAGLRVDQPRTNQPGLSVTPRVGYRSLSLGGSNELA